MLRIRAALLMFALLTIAGCTRPEDYVAVSREQQKAMQDVTAILSKIHDAQDMAAAKAELDDRLKDCDAVARKANALPKPPPEAQARLEGEQIFVQNAFDAMGREVRRVRDLPGGRAFFKQFEASSPWFALTSPGAP